MFFRMLKGALFRQKGKMLMIAFTIMLGASLATAMLNVMLDVGDKVNQELKTYGANITVVPKESSILNDIYEVEDNDAVKSSYLKEDELGNIKTIFWAFNIVDFSPFVDTSVTLNDGTQIKLTGTWFNHHMELATGEKLDTGVTNLRNWWDISDGQWIDEQKGNIDNCVMVGSALAKEHNLSVGNSIEVKSKYGSQTLTVTGIFDAGGDEDDMMFTSLASAQKLAGISGVIDKIEVSAITTPDNELARKAAKNPASLSVSQYETWYCTAYVSSICYQIQEVITDSVASPVRQVAESEGAIMEKTELLMILITIFSLLGSALGISNLVTASVMERSNEIGLMKAIGASDRSVLGIVLTEIMMTAVIGGVAGYFVGYGFAQVIGQSVFGSEIEMKILVIPIVAILILAVTLAGSIPAIRMLLRLRPAEVLHGR